MVCVENKECEMCIKERGGRDMRDEFMERWRQTVTDLWRTVNCAGGCWSGERYVITLGKGS